MEETVTRKKAWYDYGQVLKNLRLDLIDLRHHILEHQLIADADEVGEEIAAAISMLDVQLESEVSHACFQLPRTEGWIDHVIERETQSWNELFDYLRDNMQKWWD